jgi:uncharacterized protein YebE (UPF0316 family)
MGMNKDLGDAFELAAKLSVFALIAIFIGIGALLINLFTIMGMINYTVGLFQYALSVVAGSVVAWKIIPYIYKRYE